MNKFLLQLSELSWPKVAIGALIAGALYFFFYRDDGSQIKTALEQTRGQLSEAQTKLAATKKAMEHATNFEKEVLAEKAQFAKVVDIMPPKFSVADLTTLISEKAARSSVRLLSTAPKSSASGNSQQNQQSAAEKNIVDTVKVTFKIEGSFSQILSFLSQISRDPRLITFDNTEMTTLSGSQPDAPTLEFTGDIVGYRYKNPEKPAEPAGAPSAAPGPNGPPKGGPNAKS